MPPEVLVAFITSGFALLGSLLAIIVPRLWQNTNHLKAQTATLKTVQDQVQNSHGSNLRDDIDNALKGIGLLLAGQEKHSEELSSLRTDLTLERRERIDLAHRVDALNHEGAMQVYG